MDLKKLGYKEKDGNRIGPLKGKILDELDLSDAKEELSELAGREVNFMLYDDPRAFYSSGDLIQVYDYE